MGKQNKRIAPLRASLKEGMNAALRPTDQAVLKYLHELTSAGGGNTCVISIPKIASACGISGRQVQISTNRLIKAGLLKRTGYDFSNPDRAKRGTVYKVLRSTGDTEHQSQETNQTVKKGAIKFLLFWSED